MNVNAFVNHLDAQMPTPAQIAQQKLDEETDEQLAARTCQCKNVFKSVRGLNVHLRTGGCKFAKKPIALVPAPAVPAPAVPALVAPPPPPSDFAKALADLAEQSEKRFLEFKKESELTLANLTEVMSKISEKKKTFAAVAAAPAPAPAPATPSPLPSLPASPPESVSSHNPNPTLDFIFKKMRVEQTSDYWWVLKEAYNINPDRFEIAGLSHYSNEEEMAHITISYRIQTYKGSWVKNYFHIYHDGDPNLPCYRTITGAGLNRTTIILAVFHSKK
jgi:hypothetical protein